MTRARAHRIVDHDNREGPQRIAALAQQMHFRNLLVERAARQRDPQRIGCDRAGLVADALRATVLVPLVAEHTVVDLAEHLARVEAFVGELESFAPPQPGLWPDHGFGHGRIRPHDLNQMHRVDGFGKPKDDPVLVARVVHVRRRPPFYRLDVGGDGVLLLLATGDAGRFLAIQQVASESCQRKFPGAIVDQAGHRAIDERVIVRRGRDATAAFEQRQRAPANEIDLEAEEIVVGPGLRDHRLDVRPDAEQPRQKAADVRRHRDDQI
jgi:hypothetical protein